MSISKEKLIYDASTPADGDSVAAFLRTAAGALTSTNISGKEALDVNVANSITVDVDLDAATDSIVSWTADGSGNLIGSTSGALNVYLTNTSLAVTATDLDIRDITHVSDSIKVGDGTDFLAINADGSINAVVSATDLDIRNLSSAQDSVAAVQSGAWTVGQSGVWSVGLTDLVADDAADAGGSLKVGSVAKGAALAAVSAAGDRADLISDLFRRVYVNSSANIGLSQAQVAVTTTAASLGSALAGRRKVLVQNLGSKAIYLGGASVTASGATGGVRVAAGGNVELELGEYVALYAIAESGSQNVAFFQMA